MKILIDGKMRTSPPPSRCGSRTKWCDTTLPGKPRYTVHDTLPLDLASVIYAPSFSLPIVAPPPAIHYLHKPPANESPSNLAVHTQSRSHNESQKRPPAKAEHGIDALDRNTSSALSARTRRPCASCHTRPTSNVSKRSGRFFQHPQQEIRIQHHASFTQVSRLLSLVWVSV